MQKVWGSLEGSGDERNGLATIFIKLRRQLHERLEEGLLRELISSGDPGRVASVGWEEVATPRVLGVFRGQRFS